MLSQITFSRFSCCANSNEAKAAFTAALVKSVGDCNARWVMGNLTGGRTISVWMVTSFLQSRAALPDSELVSFSLSPCSIKSSNTKQAKDTYLLQESSLIASAATVPIASAALMHATHVNSARNAILPQIINWATSYRHSACIYANTAPRPVRNEPSRQQLTNKTSKCRPLSAQTPSGKVSQLRLPCVASSIAC